MLTFFGFTLAGMLLAIVYAETAYFSDQCFFPYQMIRRWNKAGVPVCAHGGFWGDLVLLPPLLAFIITRYGNTWTINSIGLMTAVGVGVVSVSHLVLVSTQRLPNPFGWRGVRWSKTIALRLAYRSVAVMLAGLFYFSPGVTIPVAIGVSLALGIYLLLDLHIPLGIVNAWYKWVWCPDVFDNAALPYLVGIFWAMLAVLAGIAAGWQALFWVAVMGAPFLGMVSLFVESNKTERFDGFYGS